MRRTLIKGFAAFAGVAVWAAAAGGGFFSTTGPVIALVAGELFTGEAEATLGGSGTLSLRSSAGPDITCSGQFGFSAELGDAGSMHCSDGTSGTFQFRRLGMLRGYGSGSSSRGPMTFTYGLSADEAAPYLYLVSRPIR